MASGNDPNPGDAGSPDQPPTSTDQPAPDAGGPSGDEDPSDQDEASSAGTSLGDAMDQAIESNEVNQSVFANKRLLKHDTTVERERIVGRDEQLTDVTGVYSDYVTGDGPSNLLLIGKSGTGKTLIAKAVAETAQEKCANRNNRLGVFEINCKNVPSRDRAIYKLFQEVINDSGPITTEESLRCAAETLEKPPEDVTPSERKHYGIRDVPDRGISTDEKWDRLCRIIDWRYDDVLFILDEIDCLEDPGETEEDEPAYSKLLYRLSRAGEREEIDGAVSITATTNVPKFSELLDSRSSSSFTVKEIDFPPYNSTQLREILTHREDAFRDGVLDEGVIELCAAFGAKTHGDARRAIDLFRETGEIAEDDETTEMVTVEHAQAAESEIEKDRTMSYISGLTSQNQMAIYSVAMIAYHESRGLDAIPYPVAFQVYNYLCEHVDLSPVTRTSFLRYLGEFETAGIIEETETVGRGFGKGTFKQGRLSPELETLIETLQDTYPAEAVGGAAIGDADGEYAESVQKVVKSLLSEHYKGRSLSV